MSRNNPYQDAGLPQYYFDVNLPTNAELHYYNSKGGQVRPQPGQVFTHITSGRKVKVISTHGNYVSFSSANGIAVQAWAYKHQFVKFYKL
jgi:hypothetical protein